VYIAKWIAGYSPCSAEPAVGSRTSKVAVKLYHIIQQVGLLGRRQQAGTFQLETSYTATEAGIFGICGPVRSVGSKASIALR